MKVDNLDTHNPERIMVRLKNIGPIVAKRGILLLGHPAEEFATLVETHGVPEGEVAHVDTFPVDNVEMISYKPATGEDLRWATIPNREQSYKVLMDGADATGYWTRVTEDGKIQLWYIAGRLDVPEGWHPFGYAESLYEKGNANGRE